MKKLHFISLVLAITLNCPFLFATNHFINVEDNEFSPSNLIVNLGDTVTWSWDNSAGAHTTTSTTIPAGAASWDSPIDQNNQNFSYVVLVAGSYNYQCTFHVSMGMTGHFSTGTTGITSAGTAEPTVEIISLSNNMIEITINPDQTVTASVKIYNLAGNMVKSFDQTPASTGMYSLGDLAAGIYFVRAEAGSFILTRKIVIH